MLAPSSCISLLIAFFLFCDGHSEIWNKDVAFSVRMRATHDIYYYSWSRRAIHNQCNSINAIRHLFEHFRHWDHLYSKTSPSDTGKIPRTATPPAATKFARRRVRETKHEIAKARGSFERTSFRYRSEYAELSLVSQRFPSPSSSSVSVFLFPCCVTSLWAT